MTGPCSVPIGGVVEPGFEAVRRVFLENFSARGEVGAACCVYWRGRAVVDLWGGWRDRARRAPWERDTLALVFSATKGMASAAMAVAHARGLFELDEPVARSWPDFAQGGKARVTVRQLMDHQAGLAAVRTRLTPGLLADPESLGRALACERPCWDPGARHGYHGLTLGWYQSELLRRVDPRGRTLGRYFAEEVAAPLGAEFYIGLPGAIDPDRLAAIVPFRPWHLLLHMNTLPARAVLAALTPGSLTRRSFFNPRLRTPA
ncbi:MAG TPA: serine hydrolase domain-containing protein, partial [Phycisphaerales bacterium]|nr:serine hydrolase domain-containing protein [Phycisphaerales bacterium]